MAVRTLTPLHQAYAGLCQRLEVVFPRDLFAHEMLPPKMDQAAFSGLVQRAPFVGLGWADLRPRGRNGRLFEADQVWALYLIAMNPGGVKPRFVGDAFGIGLFHMISAAIATLSGHTIAGLGTVEMTACANTISPEWDMGNAVLAEFTLSIPCAWEPAPVLDDIELSGRLKTLGIDWPFAQGDQVETAIRDVTPLGSEAA